MTTPITTPLYNVAAGEIYKVNIETTARAVTMGDGGNLEDRINLLSRAVAGGVQFAPNEAALAGVGAKAGALYLTLDNNFLFLRMPDSSWLKIGGGNG